MNGERTRRDFLRDVGLGAAMLPFVSNLPSVLSLQKPPRKQRLVILFSPDGIVPSTFWPDSVGQYFDLKGSLKPLEPFKKQTLILHGVSDRIRGDGWCKFTARAAGLRYAASWYWIDLSSRLVARAAVQQKRAGVFLNCQICGLSGAPGRASLLPKDNPALGQVVR